MVAQKNLGDLSDPNYYLPQIIANGTRIISDNFSTSMMFDARTVGINGTAGFYPFELNDTQNMKSWQNNTILIARNLSTNDISTTDDLAGLPSYIAKKLDIKFDDGMPYTGDIISGQNISKMGSGTGCTTSTAISTTATPPFVLPSVSYITSKTDNLTDGCVTVWKM